jgi:hypothetical protein
MSLGAKWFSTKAFSISVWKKKCAATNIAAQFLFLFADE